MYQDKYRGNAFSHKSEYELKVLRELNNPQNEPTGAYTGRCSCCGSKDLWDDNLHYGCKCCGVIFFGG